jgi:hypothetical protein
MGTGDVKGSAQKLVGILSAKCPVSIGLLRTVYAKLFLYDPKGLLVKDSVGFLSILENHDDSGNR